MAKLEVASAIATELQLALSGEPLVEAPTRDLEAYDLYLKGRFHWEQRGSSLFQAQRCFEEALARDADFAEAWAGLADTLSLLANWGLVSPLEVMPAAREAAEQALALDPELAAAHTALGFITETYDWDAAAAEERYLRALRLDPDSVQTRYWYGLNLAVSQRRLDEALEQFRIARELDPLALLPLAFQGFACYQLRRFDEAEEVFELAIERHPRSAVPLLYLSWICIVTDRLEQAEELLTRSVALDETVGWRDLAYVRARLGDPTLARQRYAEMKAGDAVLGHGMLLPMGLGLTDEAIDAAEQLVARRDDVRFLRDPRYDSLREDPRYRALLAKIWGEEQ